MLIFAWSFCGHRAFDLLGSLFVISDVILCTSLRTRSSGLDNHPLIPFPTKNNPFSIALVRTSELNQHKISLINEELCLYERCYGSDCFLGLFSMSRLPDQIARSLTLVGYCRPRAFLFPVHFVAKHPITSVRLFSSTSSLVVRSYLGLLPRLANNNTVEKRQIVFID